MAQILVRYVAGGPSLIDNAAANAESNEPVAQMARASPAANRHRFPAQPVNHLLY